MISVRPIMAVLLLVMLVSCKAEKEPINYGKDVCEHCKMIAMDPKFGAEVITAKGKIYKFDDVNCMVSYMKTVLSNAEIAEIYVADFIRPGELISANSAHYVYSEAVRSPMASGVAAFSDQQSMAGQNDQWQGTVLDWEAINKKFE